MSPAARIATLAVAAAGLLAACSARTATEVPLTPTAPAVTPAVQPSSPAMDQVFAKAAFEVPSRELASTDFTLSTLEGKKVSLSSYKGKVVVLSFWATWCPPCKEEMPEMEALYKDIAAKGFTILAIDVGEDKATVEKFVKENGYTFPILLDTKEEIAGLYGTQALPSNYVVDAKGYVRARVVGVGGPKWTSPEMRAVFDRLLAP
jgi:thiol-disulfide isomerase/thioredoxin